MRGVIEFIAITLLLAFVPAILGAWLHGAL